MRTTWTFYSAGQVLFGRHAVRQLGDVVVRLGGRRLLVVTDPNLAKMGLVEHIRGPLEEKSLAVEIFDHGEPEPSLHCAEACIAAARAFRPDVLVGLGGGSNMDLSKITAVVMTHGGAPRDYIGEDRVPGPVLPVVCVPTTAGTGSEVSASSVLTDSDQHMKVGILSNHLRPRAAIVDPLLTVSCPPRVTADTGIDALTHAIEAYTAVDNVDFPLPPGERTVYQGKHPLGDMLAEKAITLVAQYLRRAVAQADDLEAREGMSLAATLAGLAFSNVGVALVHAMEYPVGGAVHCSHGTGNGLLLPFVMRYNLPARPKEFATIARLLGREESAEQAISAVESLKADIGIPTRLRDLGVCAEQIPAFAEKAAGIRRILRVNPRAVTVADIKGIFQDAL